MSSDGFDAGRYLHQRERQLSGFDEANEILGLRTTAERSNDIEARRARLELQSRGTPGGREATLAAARARYGGGSESPRSTGRRVETNSGRPGTLTRGPGQAPAAMVGAVRGDGSDARVCAHTTCKAINISHEGPAREFCSEHG